MAKYLLSYDEQDVKNGNLDVSPDGVLKSAGTGASDDTLVIYMQDISGFIMVLDASNDSPIPASTVVEKLKKSHRSVRLIDGVLKLNDDYTGFTGIVFSSGFNDGNPYDRLSITTYRNVGTPDARTYYDDFAPSDSPVYLNSSSGKKRFQLKVDDSGTLSATEVTG